MKQIIKKIMAVILACVMVSNIGVGAFSLQTYAATESTFLFDGSNAEQYNGESTVEFDLQTIDLTDMQVAKLIEQFQSQQSVTKVVFDSSVRLIGQHVFEGLYTLETVDFTNAKNLKVIEDYAFSGCTSLSASVYLSGKGSYVTKTEDGILYLPATLRYFGEGCFMDTLIKSYVIDSDNAVFSTQDGVLYNKNKNSIVGYPVNRSGSYEIPQSVSEIYRYAFEGSGITKLTVPSSLKTIGTRAFYNASLKNVIFDDNNNITIGAGAFYQDPEKEEFKNVAHDTWQGISQVKISEETYNNSVANIENTDSSACFTPYSKISYNGNDAFEIGCDIYVVPKVSISGVPNSWAAATNLNFFWNNTDYSSIEALYLDNEQVHFEPGSTSSDSVRVEKNGTYNLTIKYRNKNGNTASVAKNIVVSMLDSQTPAEVTYTLVDDVCYLHSYDTDSGLDQIKYTLNNSEAATYVDGFPLVPGVNTVTCWASDAVGNTNSKKTYTITIPGEKRAITLDCSAKQLTKGKSFTLNASFVPDTITNRTLSWTTSDSSIATVQDGVVTGVRVGYAVITATSVSGYTAKCAVVVTKDPTVKKEVKLYKNETYNLIVNNKRSDFDITFSSDDKKVCKVSSSGKITATGLGEATIITKVDTGVRVYSLKTVVTVSKPQVEIVKKKSTLSVGKSYRFKAYRMGLSSSITWQSSNSSVATVNKTTGKVIAHQKGITTITAKCGKYKDTCKLKVK